MRSLILASRGAVSQPSRRLVGSPVRPHVHQTLQKPARTGPPTWLESPPTFQRSADRHLIRVLEIPTHR